MSTLLKPLGVRDQLLRRKVVAFSPLEFQRIFQVNRSKAKYFLEEQTRHGVFERLKQGVYALSENLPPEEEIANLLYRPSYISFEYALAAHHILPEMVYSVTSATTKSTRTFMVDQKAFSYLTIKMEAFAGYIPAKRGGRTVLFAEPEKALVDYLYFVSLGKKARNDRLNTTHLDKSKIRRYARLYRRAGLDRLVKEII